VWVGFFHTPAVRPQQPPSLVSPDEPFRCRRQAFCLAHRQRNEASKGFKDAYYTGMNQVRTTVIQYLNVAAINLSPVENYRFPSNLPSLVLSYWLYQSVDLEPDLVARNNPVDPGFMPLTVEALVLTWN
jgi:prophage DNA circulation protein